MDRAIVGTIVEMEFIMLKMDVEYMFATRNKEELVSVYWYAKTRLEKIYEYNLQRIKEEKK